MDLDKLKKAAGNTIKVISGKNDDFISDLKNTDVEEIDDDILFDDFSEDAIFPASPSREPDNTADYSDTEDGATQKFNLQNMLERFRQKKEDIDSTFRSILDINNDSSEDPYTMEESEKKSEVEIPESSGTFGTENAVQSSPNEISALDSQIDALKKSIDELNEYTGTAVSKINKAIDNINGSFNVTDQKLTDISNSLASISKLNDSIFDLKNAQMNTKNSLADLETAFGKLKKKMTACITIISILTAIIALLEVINLLS